MWRRVGEEFGGRRSIRGIVRRCFVLRLSGTVVDRRYFFFFFFSLSLSLSLSLACRLAEPSRVGFSAASAEFLATR